METNYLKLHYSGDWCEINDFFHVSCPSFYQNNFFKTVCRIQDPNRTGSGLVTLPSNLNTSRRTHQITVQ